MKTKIYQTIKGLIILFIKLQFSIRYNQAFKPLRTLTSNIYLNLSLNSNGFVSCIIPNVFILSLIHFMILDVYLQRFLCIQSKLGPDLRICQAWRPVVYPLRGFCYPHQYLDVIIDNKTDVRTREKF